MPQGKVLSSVLLAALVGLQVAQASSSRHRRVELVLYDGTPLRAKPSSHAAVLARLVQQTQLEVLGKKGRWSHVRLWDSVSGWIASSGIAVRKPWESTSTYHAPTTKHPPRPAGPYALRAQAVALGTASVRARPVTVTGWKQDSAGSIWYRVADGWVRGDSVQFDAPDPGLTTSGNAPLWRAVSGKGMWLTLGTVTGASPQAIVVAAQRSGITHLYVEAAISPLGFHGRQSLGPLLEKAHAASIKVIAWVYPYLDDIASDIQLTRAVAAYCTPSGVRFDGIAADLEQNMVAWRLRAYSQLVRHYLGSHYLLVGVSYPPQSLPTYPFTILARTYNAIAPMDYWHQTKTTRGLDYGAMHYGFAYGYRYAVDSVTTIRRASGHVPVTPIGQTFDDFGRLEMGPHAPTAAEIGGFLQGSKDSGAIGASFFQWMTATDDEWRAIHRFRF